MGGWIYFLAPWTPELLLLEGVLLGGLLCRYLAFWILEKRPHGVAASAPVLQPLQTGIDQVWVQLHQLRTLLWGLTPPLPEVPPTSHLVSLSEQSPSDTSLLQVQQQLQTKTQECETLQATTTDLRQQLEAALAARSQTESPPSHTGDPALLQKLEGQKKELQDRLQEYSVLEEDLVNLKRLKQENEQLKKALAEASSNTPPSYEPPPPNPLPPPTEPPITPSPLLEEKKTAPANSPSVEEENLVAEFEKMLQKDR